MMRISVMTYTLASRPELYPVECYPELIAACGAHAVDWVSCYGRAPRDLRRWTHDAGLAVSAFTFALQSFRQKGDEATALDEAARRFEEAHELGAPIAMVVPLPILGLADLAENRRRWCGLLPRLAPLAREAGCLLTIENFDGPPSPFLTAEELLEACHAEPSLRFTFDIGNAALGGDPAAALDALEDLVAYVHCKDWHISDTPKDGALRGRDGRFYTPAPVGHGDVDLPVCAAALLRQGYAGFADIEYAGRELEPATAIRQSAEWMRAIGFFK